ncbi:MAG: hypothetical protein E7289_05055 [Lachnospiraceae bacterium]|nr:hypothetical protein [Lachnospiraceae bacterium]
MEHSEHFIIGTGEKLQYLVHNFNDNTIRFILHYPGSPDSAVLRLAVKKVIESSDVLHSSFCAGAVRSFWKLNKIYEEKDYFQVTETESVLVIRICHLCAVR